MNVDLNELQNWSFATYTTFLSRMRSVCPPSGEYGQSITYNLQRMDRHEVFVKMMNFLLHDENNTALRKQAIVNVFTDIGDAAQACQNYLSIRDIGAVYDSEYTQNQYFVEGVSLNSLENRWTVELEMLHKSIEEFCTSSQEPLPVPKL